MCQKVIRESQAKMDHQDPKACLVKRVKRVIEESAVYLERGARKVSQLILDHQACVETLVHLGNTACTALQESPENAGNQEFLEQRASQEHGDQQESRV